ncbi:MAG: hypothetical protein ATN35_08395 [Epulopiscium sp. Nele67-Bin004]|nr:MAG: hypothetical protein ATN35_08395 [Epulopiscium sp. Nele67-Bin004]
MDSSRFNSQILQLVEKHLISPYEHLVNTLEDRRDDNREYMKVRKALNIKEVSLQDIRDAKATVNELIDILVKVFQNLENTIDHLVDSKPYDEYLLDLQKDLHDPMPTINTDTVWDLVCWFKLAGQTIIANCYPNYTKDIAVTYKTICLINAFIAVREKEKVDFPYQVQALITQEDRIISAINSMYDEIITLDKRYQAYETDEDFRDSVMFMKKEIEDYREVQAELAELATPENIANVEAEVQSMIQIIKNKNSHDNSMDSILFNNKKSAKNLKKPANKKHVKANTLTNLKTSIPMSREDIMFSVQMFLLARRDTVCEEFSGDLYCVCVPRNYFLIKEVISYHGSIFGKEATMAILPKNKKRFNYTCSEIYKITLHDNKEIKIYIQILEDNNTAEVARYFFTAADRGLIEKTADRNYPKITMFEESVAEFAHMLKDKLRVADEQHNFSTQEIAVVLTNNLKDTPFIELDISEQYFDMIEDMIKETIEICVNIYDFNDITYEVLNNKNLILVKNSERDMLELRISYKK